MYRILTALSVAALLFCGCAPTLTVNGKTYTVLTGSEERELVEMARTSLFKSTKALSQQEREFVLQNTPDVKITYNGDRAGTAEVIWTTDKKLIAMIFKGEFFASDMGWMLRTEERQPDVLKFIKR